MLEKQFLLLFLFLLQVFSLAASPSGGCTSAGGNGNGNGRVRVNYQSESGSSSNACPSTESAKTWLNVVQNDVVLAASPTSSAGASQTSTNGLPSPATSTATASVTPCGNSSLSVTLACPFGDLCQNGMCVTPSQVNASSFFTPTVIAVIVIATLILCCGGSLLLCCACKCCCFSLKATGGALAVAGRGTRQVIRGGGGSKGKGNNNTNGASNSSSSPTNGGSASSQQQKNREFSKGDSKRYAQPSARPSLLQQQQQPEYIPMKQIRSQPAPKSSSSNFSGSNAMNKHNTSGNNLIDGGGSSKMKSTPAPLPANYRPTPKHVFNHQQQQPLEDGIQMQQFHTEPPILFQQQVLQPLYQHPQQIQFIPVQIQPQAQPQQSSQSQQIQPQPLTPEPYLIASSPAVYSVPKFPASDNYSPATRRISNPDFLNGKRDINSSNKMGLRKNNDLPIASSPPAMLLESTTSNNRELPPAGGPGLSYLHKPQMNHKVGPITSKTRQPPTAPGYFGFWDARGRFHQGFTDNKQKIHGGAFDDQTYFHFGVFGSVEPVLVEDSMMASFHNDESADGQSVISSAISTEILSASAGERMAAMREATLLSNNQTNDSLRLYGGSKPRSPPLDDSYGNHQQQYLNVADMPRDRGMSLDVAEATSSLN